MRSRTTKSFRKGLAELPEPVRRQARKAYRLFAENPMHPSLAFKKVHSVKPVWSARVNLDVRAVGVIEADTILWFWVGPRDQYETLLGKMGVV